MDGDTGWHIRTGEYILGSGKIPSEDLFSFTKAGAPWYAWEWLADVLFGVLFQWAGLKAVVLFAGALIAAYATILLRFALWRGANVMVALPLTLLAVGSSTIHFLARPHLFTLFLLPIALWIIESDRRKPGKLVWLLIPLTALWTNIHGGFAVLLVLLALLVLCLGLESWLNRPQGGSAKWVATKRYALLLAGCSGATLLNPFGIGLHIHIVEYLKSDWIRNLIQEFQAPTFRSEGQMQFEWMLILGLLIATRLLAQRKFTEALWIVFLAHSSLTSVRHAPLYACVAAPILAAELTEMWQQFTAAAGKKSLSGILYQLGVDLGPAFRRVTVWGAAVVAVIAAIDAPIPWPKDFPKEAFPVEMVQRNSKELASSRVLTTDQWADYLIFSFYPRQRVFIDGRSDFYGEKLGREYLSLMQGGFSTEKVLERYSFDLILIPVEWPLAELLKGKRGWTVREDDGKSILFASRKAKDSEAQAHPPSNGAGTGTNEKNRGSRTSSLKPMRSASTHRKNVQETRETAATDPVGGGGGPVAWRLPSGKALAEYALESGFLAPGMLLRPLPDASNSPAAAGTMATKSARGRE
jgi:hypothetical protein